MKHQDFFKQNFTFQKKIILQYKEEARDFQQRHNLAHPRHRIWKHRYGLRTFYFYVKGTPVRVRVKILRFRYAGTNRTFTFYGSLFCAFSSFSRALMEEAVAQDKVRLLLGDLCTLFSPETLSRWKSLLSVIPAPVASPGWDSAESGQSTSAPLCAIISP